MREIILDTETTGLDPSSGHRVVEIGCVELMHLVPTQVTYHTYLYPQRSMPAEAQAVHGLSDSFLSNKPLFSEIVDEFLTFIADDPLIIHNAPFDLSFLNSELTRADRRPLSAARVKDTLQLARQRFPGAPASLDALCRRFQIDLSDRALHGALKDAHLLARVYLELRGGREPGLALKTSNDVKTTAANPKVRVPRRPQPSSAEIRNHNAFVARLPKALWRTLLPESSN